MRIYLQPKHFSVKQFLKGVLLGLLFMFPNLGMSPLMTMEQTEFLYVVDYIQTSHRSTADFLEAIGKKRPPDLRRSRAERYAKILLKSVAQYENPRELLYLHILPQTRNGSGWINRRFDLDKKHKSHGIFEFQARTGKGVAGYTPAYKHLVKNPEAWWKRHLILNIVMHIELGASMSNKYRDDYGDPKYTFTAVIAGPGTMAQVHKKFEMLSRKDERNRSKLDQVLAYKKETAKQLQLMKEVYGAAKVRNFNLDKDWAVAHHHSPSQERGFPGDPGQAYESFGKFREHGHRRYSVWS